MRYVLVAAAVSLSSPLSGCTSDNMDYVGVFQPGFYNDYGGIPLDFNGYRTYRNGSYGSYGYRLPDRNGLRSGELHRLQ